MIATAEVKVGHVLDVLAGMPERSVHSCVTSPPYWGLRCYKTPPQDWGDWTGDLGLEPTIDLYLSHLVGVFDAVRACLRDDGALWVNLGDSYWSDTLARSDAVEAMWGNRPASDLTAGRAAIPESNRRGGLGQRPPGVKPLDCCNIPFRFALAMQEAGWYHRSTIIWAKGLSFCDSYSGSVMPESVNGWRYEGDKLRKGSWRPTSAYEFVFLFAKTKDYYCDAEAVREESPDSYRGQARLSQGHQDARPDGANRIQYGERQEPCGRNPRNVWCINPQPFPDSHFAVFPEALVTPIVKVSTSEKGVCPECGSPWARVVENQNPQAVTRGRTAPQQQDQIGEGRLSLQRPTGLDACGHLQNRGMQQIATLGWRPTCGCMMSVRAGEVRYGIEAGPPCPATVLDPFAGSGTTLLVARKLGRHSIGIELSEDYAKMARDRIGAYAPLFGGSHD